MAHKVRHKDLARLLDILGVFDGWEVGACVIMKGPQKRRITLDLVMVINKLRTYTDREIYPEHVLSWQCVCGKVHSDGSIHCPCNRQED